MTRMNNKLTIRFLIAAFKEAGLPVSPSWIRRQEDKGNLTLPRSTTNFKKAQGTRKIGALRIMNKEQINKAVQAFSPEGIELPSGLIGTGKGYYNYQNE